MFLLTIAAAAMLAASTMTAANAPAIKVKPALIAPQPATAHRIMKPVRPALPILEARPRLGAASRSVVLPALGPQTQAITAGKNGGSVRRAIKPD